jgi:hypothetical protein
MSELEECFKKLIGKKVVISGDDMAHVSKSGKSQYVGGKGMIVGWKPKPQSKIGAMTPIIKLEGGTPVCDSNLMWSGEDEPNQRF